MQSKTAAIIGATGMTGQYLLELLLQDNWFDTVRILVRRPYSKSDPKMEVKLVDFSDTESFKLALEEADTVFCCVGTTQKKVKGDKAQYRKVDYDIPVKAARLGRETGCEKFIHMSAAGASSGSRNFYLRLKGEVEESLKDSGIRSIHIMRPSILLGDRKEFRLGEQIGRILAPLVSFLLPGKYKPVHARTVARAMLAAAKKDKPGFFIYEFREIKNLAG